MVERNGEILQYAVFVRRSRLISHTIARTYLSAQSLVSCGIVKSHSLVPPYYVMRSFFTYCCVLGLLTSGFVLTGDAGWLMKKGTALLNTTTVPSDWSMWKVSPRTPMPEKRTQDIQPVSSTPTDDSREYSSWPNQDVATAPQPIGGETTPNGLLNAQPVLLTQVEVPHINLRFLKPGDRMTVGIGSTHTTFEIIDPHSGEALRYPEIRRVMIAGATTPHRIEKGHMFFVCPRTHVNELTMQREEVGPVRVLYVHSDEPGSATPR